MELLVSGYAHRSKRIYGIKARIPDEIASLILAFYMCSLSKYEYVAVFLNKETNSGHFAAFSLRTEPSCISKRIPPQFVRCAKPGVCFEELGTTVKLFKLNQFPDSIRHHLFPKFQNIRFSDKGKDGLHVMVRVEGENRMAPNLCTAYCLETDDLCVLPYSSTPIDRSGLLQSRKHGLLAVGGYDFESTTAYKEVQVLKSREEVMAKMEFQPMGTGYSGYTSPNINGHGGGHNGFGPFSGNAFRRSPYGFGPHRYGMNGLNGLNGLNGYGHREEDRSRSSNDGEWSALNGLCWVSNWVPAMHTARSNQGIVMMEDENKIFVCGGWTSSILGDTNTAELYSFESDVVGSGCHSVSGMNREWTVLGAMNDAHLCHGTCYDAISKTVFIVGGTRDHQSHQFECYNFERDRWYTMPSTLFPHKWFPSLKMVDESMIVCCGNHYDFRDGRVDSGWGESEFLDFREGGRAWHILDDQLSAVLGYQGVDRCDHKMRGLWAI